MRRKKHGVKLFASMCPDRQARPRTGRPLNGYQYMPFRLKVGRERRPSARKLHVQHFLGLSPRKNIALGLRHAELRNCVAYRGTNQQKNKTGHGSPDLCWLPVPYAPSRVQRRPWNTLMSTTVRAGGRRGSKRFLIVALFDHIWPPMPHSPVE